MRRATVPLLVFVLAACQAPVTGSAAGTKPRTGVAPSVKPTAGVSAKPSAKVSVAPRGPVTRLAGQIKLDARYAVASGALAIAPGGAALVSNNGGSVRDPAGLLAPHATGLVGKIRLLSDQGGGLLSNNGAGLRLLQVPSANLPAAGMVLGVYSLVDGGLLPIAVDDLGQPVYTLLTGADGGFAVDLPAAVAGNVLVVASVPGTRDPGLAVDLIARAAPAADLAIDDASTVATEYLIQAVAGRLDDTYAPDPCRPAGPPPDHADSLSFVLDTYTDALKQPAFTALPLEAKRFVLRRFAGFVVSGLDLAAIKALRSEQPALAVVQELIADAEQAAAEQLAAKPTAFDDRDWIRVAKVEHGAAGLPLFRKASDLTAFMVREYLTTLDNKRVRFLEPVLADLALDPARVQGLVDAAQAVFLAIVELLQQDGAGARGQALLDTAIAEASALPATPPVPCLAVSTAATPAITVATLAGSGADGATDGPGLAAAFSGPSRLAIDPAGRWLYVSERTGGRIRAIDLASADHAVHTVASGLADPGGMAIGPGGDLYVAARKNHAIRRIQDPAGPTPVVTTLAGDGTEGFADGPGTTARFAVPTDLAIGDDGALYVADTQNRRIRRVDLAAQAHLVTTFTGPGPDEGGWAAGIGAAARIDQPRGILAISGRGFVVADTRGDRLGRLSPAAVLARLAGREADLKLDGSWFQATFEGPQGLALTTEGDIAIADTDNHLVRLLVHDGRVLTLAGQHPAAKGGPGSYAEGPGAAARFAFPEGIAAGPDGRLYVADTKNNRIRVLTR